MRAIRTLTPASYAILRRLVDGPATTGELIAAQVAADDDRKPKALQRLPDTLFRSGMLEPVARNRGRGRQNTWALTRKGCQMIAAHEARLQAEAEAHAANVARRVCSVFGLGAMLNGAYRAVNES